MPEIVDLEVIEQNGTEDITPFLHSFRSSLMRDAGNISEIVTGVHGVYRDHMLMTDSGSWPVHFKKREWIPPNGTRINIKRAQIGYYKKRKELVVWARKDFETE
jgi:hypothetical protein